MFRLFVLSWATAALRAPARVYIVDRTVSALTNWVALSAPATTLRTWSTWVADLTKTMLEARTGAPARIRQGSWRALTLAMIAERRYSRPERVPCALAWVEDRARDWSTLDPVIEVKKSRVVRREVKGRAALAKTGSNHWERGVITERGVFARVLPDPGIEVWSQERQIFEDRDQGRTFEVCRPITSRPLPAPRPWVKVDRTVAQAMHADLGLARHREGRSVVANPMTSMLDSI
jgi:hypothetical protein